MRNTITFAGVNLSTYGVYISGRGVFNAPARAVEKIVVPGRDGEYANRISRLQNVTVTYPAFIVRNFNANIAGLREWLLSDTVGYKVLVDSYNPGEFRRALFAGPLDVEPTALLNAGSFELSFDCLPQRWLNTGATAQTFTADGTITNPTRFNAKPLIRIYGKGQVKIRDTVIEVSANSPYASIDIDCANGLILGGATNAARYVSISGLELPVLKYGSNNVKLYTGITQVDITPRWWTV